MMDRISNFIRFQLPAVAWGAVIYYISSLPSSRLPKIKLVGVDKLIHMLIFMVFGLLLYRALHPLRKLNGFDWRRALIALVVVVMYGIVDEFHQGIVPGRTEDVLDACADAAGGLLAVGIIYFATRSARTQVRE